MDWQKTKFIINSFILSKMKKIFLFTAFMYIAVASYSQDLISLKKGTRINAIVTEITPTLVRYKLFSEPKGKVYFVYKEDVSGIMYQSGKIETFNQSNEQKTEAAPQENDNQKLKSSNKKPKEHESIYSSKNERKEENQQSSSIGNSRDDLETTNQTVNNRNQMGDFILLRDGTRKMVTVLEITPDAIKYRDYDNPNGAIYTINKSDATKVIFQNGKEETFIPERNPLEWVDNKIYLDGNKLSNNEIKNLFQGTNSLALYNQSKLYKNLGIGVALLGVIPLGIGAGGLASFKDMGGGTDASGISKGNYVVMIASGAVISTCGLVLSFQGEKYRKRAVELYNQSSKRKSDLSLNVGLVGNGLGFKVTF